MNADVRLFVYALAPQLERLSWRLDEAMAALAAAAREVERHRDDCTALDERVGACVQEANAARAAGVDVRRAQAVLDFLAGLRRRRAQAGATLAEAQSREQARREALAALRVEIDKLERDRAERLEEHVRERQRLAARDADQDWTARAHWRAANARPAA